MISSAPSVGPAGDDLERRERSLAVVVVRDLQRGRALRRGAEEPA
jgi:hypothetical protein